MLLLLTLGCQLSREDQAAVVATAAYVAASPVVGRIGSTDQGDGESDDFADDYAGEYDDQEIGTIAVDGTIEWSGDPEGACAVSGKCTSSEADVTADGKGTLRRGAWCEGPLRLEGGDGDDEPAADFPDVDVTFSLSGHVRDAPELLEANDFDTFPGAEFEGTVTIAGGAPVTVTVELGWTFGADTFDVKINGLVVRWECETST